MGLSPSLPGPAANLSMSANFYAATDPAQKLALIYKFERQFLRRVRRRVNFRQGVIHLRPRLNRNEFADLLSEDWKRRASQQNYRANQPLGFSHKYLHTLAIACILVRPSRSRKQNPSPSAA